jgi:hypothetical protein
MTVHTHLSTDVMRTTGKLQSRASVTTRLRGSESGVRALDNVVAYEPSIARWIEREAADSKQDQQIAGRGAGIVKRGRRP